MPPGRLKDATIWLKDIAADVAVPELQVSRSPSKGRAFDHFVCSRAILPMIPKVEPDPSASWAPHLGLLLRLDAMPRFFKVLRFAQPPPLALAFEEAAGAQAGQPQPGLV